QHAGKVLFRLLRRVLEPLHRHLVAGQVDAVFFFEFLHQVIDDRLVEIVPSQLIVSAGGLHFKQAVPDLQNGHVKGSAAQVEHQDGLIFLLIQSVGEGGSGVLVDDSQHFQAGDPAGVLGRLPLAVVEVSGNRDQDRKSTRLNSSHVKISYAVFCLKKKKAEQE